jgi:2,3-bisphosphoglycerate-independent phosphoglycerate mutase
MSRRTSALDYVDQLEAVLKELSTDGCDYAIASGGGRSSSPWTATRRTGAWWARGWAIHGRGAAVRLRPRRHREIPRRQPGGHRPGPAAFVIARDGKPVGRCATNDSVIMINFRGDRAMETCRAFETRTSPSSTAARSRA